MDMWPISYLGGGGGGSGTPAVVIDVMNAFYESTATDPASASVSVHFDSLGNVTYTGTFGSSYSWMTNGTAADYSVRITVTNGGTMDSGNAGSWLNLGTIRTFTVSRSGVGTDSIEGTLEIRRDSDGSVLDTATITMTATVVAGEGDGGGNPGGGLGGNGSGGMNEF